MSNGLEATHAKASSAAQTWIVLPTYNERGNLADMVSAINSFLPATHILVVDDNSPDGTGDLADELARLNEHVSVLHRTNKEGLGAAYRAGFAAALESPTTEVVVQMDCDFSHDPSDLPRLLEQLDDGADLAIGSRYVHGGTTPGWGIGRRLVSRGGGLFARTVLSLPYRDLTGGFKAWRANRLRAVIDQVAYANGYGFQIETTWLTHAQGAKIVEIPITFHERQLGQSKMTGGIVAEALLLVLRLRLRSFRANQAT